MDKPTPCTLQLSLGASRWLVAVVWILTDAVRVTVGGGAAGPHLPTGPSRFPGSDPGCPRASEYAAYAGHQAHGPRTYCWSINGKGGWARAGSRRA
jgi:hypothetical protein